MGKFGIHALSRKLKLLSLLDRLARLLRLWQLWPAWLSTALMIHHPNQSKPKGHRSELHELLSSEWTYRRTRPCSSRARSYLSNSQSWNCTSCLGSPPNPKVLLYSALLYSTLLHSNSTSTLVTPHSTHSTHSTHTTHLGAAARLVALHPCLLRPRWPQALFSLTAFVLFEDRNDCSLPSTCTLTHEFLANSHLQKSSTS